ncbi:MAG: isopentenyl-diphosphate Delta-isomerase [Candidatus Saccharimonadales bacterium]
MNNTALEKIVLLNKDNEVIGAADKLSSHHAHTPYHLAFSIYIFNNKKELLVTKRSLNKKVWPGVWTNSCCGHPAPSESFEDAIQRRTMYELNLEVMTIQKIVPNYRYQTPLFNNVIENEFCPIYLGTTTMQPTINVNEVAEYKWLHWDNYVAEVQSDDDNIYSWWAKDQLHYLYSNPLLLNYMKEAYEYNQ